MPVSRKTTECLHHSCTPAGVCVLLRKTAYLCFYENSLCLRVPPPKNAAHPIQSYIAVEREAPPNRKRTISQKKGRRKTNPRAVPSSSTRIHTRATTSYSGSTHRSPRSAGPLHHATAAGPPTTTYTSRVRYLYIRHTRTHAPGMPLLQRIAKRSDSDACGSSPLFLSFWRGGGGSGPTAVHDIFAALHGSCTVMASIRDTFGTRTHSYTYFYPATADRHLHSAEDHSSRGIQLRGSNR